MNFFSKKCKSLGIAIFLFLVLSPLVFALSIPDKPQGYVNDYAGLLSGPAREKIENTLAVFDQETSSQIFVAIFPSMEGESLEDFSIRLFNQWKPGTKKNDNGILLIVFRDERKIRIEVGYGLEGALPDAVASQIIREEMTPAFREGNYDRGIMNAVEAMMRATRGEYESNPRRQEDRLQKYSPLLFVMLLAYLLLPVVCYLMILFGSVILLGPALGFLVALLLIVFFAVVRAFFSSSFFGQTYSGKSGGIWGGGGGGFSGGGFGGGFGGGGGGGGGGGASGGW